MDGKAVFLSLISCVLLSGCQRQPESSEAQLQKSIPPQAAAAAPSTAVSPSPPTVPSRGTGNVASGGKAERSSEQNQRKPGEPPGRERRGDCGKRFCERADAHATGCRGISCVLARLGGGRD